MLPARAATAPVIPVTIVASRPSPIGTFRHLLHAKVGAGSRALEGLKPGLGQKVQSGLSAIAALPLTSFFESPIGTSRFVYYRRVAHDLPERGPRLSDPAEIARSHS